MAPRPRPTRTAPPSRRPRGDVYRQLAQVLVLLSERGRRPAEIVDALDCSRSTVDRILQGLRAAGFPLRCERVTRSEAYYMLSGCHIPIRSLASRPPRS